MIATTIPMTTGAETELEPELALSADAELDALDRAEVGEADKDE